MLLIFVLVSCYMGTSIEDIYQNAVTFKSSLSPYHSKYVQKVVIDDGTLNSDFYITTDGSNPTESNTHVNRYDNEFLLFNGVDFRVILGKLGRVPVFTYNVPGNLDEMITIESQYYSSSQQNVTISGNEENVYFHYTLDGSVPDRNDPYLYSNNKTSVSKTLLVDNGTKVSVRGRINRSGYPEMYSPIVTYTAPYSTPVSVPTIIGSYFSSTQKTIAISCNSSEATVYYTIDGTSPDINDYMYIESFVAANGTVIKAAAYKDGYLSEEATYVVSTDISIPNITDAYYSSNEKTVTITCDTEDSVIYYTTDGSTPNMSSCMYSGSFVAINSTTVKAKAYKDEYWSEEISYTVSIPTIDTPTMSVACYSDSFMYVYLKSTSGSTIYYTTDGTVPDITANKYTGAAICVYDGSTIKARAYKDRYWSEVMSYDVITSVDKPSVNGSYYSDDFMNITIKCDTPDAVIYYTTDGTIPNTSDNIYKGAFAVANGTTLKARAYRDNYYSGVETYEISTFVAMPTITSSYYSSIEKIVNIDCSTEGATVYFTTDGITPNISDNLYSESFSVLNGTTVKAMAYKDGYWSDSAVHVASIPNIDMPNIVGTSYSASSARVYIFCDMDDATIYYTTDGTTPDASDLKYTGSIIVANEKTVKARALLDGYWSEVDTYKVLTSVDTPTITSFYASSTQKYVEMNCSTEDATIYYTTDGSVPDIHSNFYYGMFTVDIGATVIARAYRGGYWSKENTHNVEIPTMHIPTINVSYYSDTYADVTIVCKTADSEIYYTTDGSVPDNNDSKYEGSFLVLNNETVKARAYKDGYWSDMVSYDISTFVAPPEILEVACIKSGKYKVIISCKTQDATIYYQLQNSGYSGNVYRYDGSAIEVSKNLNVRAYAVKNGYRSKDVYYYY